MISKTSLIPFLYPQPRRQLGFVGLCLVVAATSGCKSEKPPTKKPAVASKRAPVPSASTAPKKPKATPISKELPALSPQLFAKQAIVCKAKQKCSFPPADAPAKNSHYLPKDKEGVGPTAASFIYQLNEGASLTIPALPTSDVYLVGISGAGNVEADKQDLPLGAYAAVRAADGNLVVKPSKGAALRVALLLGAPRPGAWLPIEELRCKAPKPDCKQSSEWLKSWRKEAPEKTDKRALRLARVDLKKLPDLAWGGGAYHARLAFDKHTSRYVGLGVLRLSADAGVPAHMHASSWEHLLVLEGKGQVSVGAAAKKSQVTAGSWVQVPPRTLHQWLPGKSQPFLALQLYGPPGAEQRFKTLAAKGNGGGKPSGSAKPASSAPKTAK